MQALQFGPEFGPKFLSNLRPSPARLKTLFKLFYKNNFIRTEA